MWDGVTQIGRLVYLYTIELSVKFKRVSDELEICIDNVVVVLLLIACKEG